MRRHTVCKWVGGVVVLTAFAGITRGGLVITEVMSSSSHPNGASESDWFELTNNGTTPFSLVGLTWDDAGGGPGNADFASTSTAITSLAPGVSGIVTGESIGAEAAWRTAWGIPSTVQVVNLGNNEFQNLGSGGDEIHVYNGSAVGSTEITGVTFLTATAGRSFVYDSNGTSLGTAVAGQNGAFVAPSNGAGGAGTDVGSPGVVPEPAGVALLAAAGLLTLRRRPARGRVL